MLAVYLFIAHWRTAQVLRLSQQLRGMERQLFEERVTATVQKRMREQAQESEVAKTRLLQAASHDLRQPLHALGLYLSHAFADVGKGQEGRWLPAIQQSFDSLSSMFDALLDWSRLEAGSLEPDLQHVEASALFERLGAEFRELAAQKNLRFHVNTVPLVLHTDPALLERTLRNLLMNAVRYTASGHVTLQGRLREGRACLRIADTGPGIPHRDRERVFRAFERGDVERRDGLGLGLAIVRYTVDLLGYRMDMRSSTRRGTVFTLSVPLAAMDVTTAQTVPLPTVGNRRAFVIEDDPHVLAATAAVLEELGMQVDRARSLAEARHHLARACPHLLLVDQHLPDGTGTAFLAERDDACARIPVVLMSGDLDFAAGFQKSQGLMMLTKPVSPLRLRSVVHFMLSQTSPI